MFPLHWPVGAACCSQFNCSSSGNAGALRLIPEQTLLYAMAVTLGALEMSLHYLISFISVYFNEPLTLRPCCFCFADEGTSCMEKTWCICGGSWVTLWFCRGKKGRIKPTSKLLSHGNWSCFKLLTAVFKPVLTWFTGRQRSHQSVVIINSK